MNRSVFIRLAAGVFTLSVAAGAFAAEATRLVAEYHPMEGSRSLLLKRGLLVAGRSGYEADKPTAIELLNPSTGEVVKRVVVRHAVRDVQAVDDCKIMGFGSEGYTVVDLCADDYPAQSFAFGEEFVPFVGGVGADGSIVFSDPNVGLLTFRDGSAVRRVGRHVSMAVSMAGVNNEYWFPHYDGITIVDPARSGGYMRMDAAGIYGYKYVAAVGTSVVATAREDGKVVVIDPETKAVVKAVDVKGEPEGLAVLGQCAVVADSANKTIAFVKIDGEDSAVVDTWDASSAGDKLKMPAQIAIDADAMTVYLRSSYPCPTCSATQSSLYAVTNVDSNPVADCGL